MTRKARPPAAAVAEAKKMLKWRDKYGRKQVKGATRVGWTRAQQLAEVDDRYKGTPWKDRGRVAWGTWGGTSGVNWAIRTVKKWNREDKQKAAKKRQNKRAQRRRKRQR
jgi:hypothetical protein